MRRVIRRAVSKENWRLTKTFQDFFSSEKSGGIVLLICTVLSLLLTNFKNTGNYVEIWTIPLFGHDFKYWINDGLMVIFFLMIGLELSRELNKGELVDIKKALLPIMAAIGGMLFPAAIHFSLNQGTVYERGFGIPMATDIAFAVGILSILGKLVPPALKVFLIALAIIDDLGAILIIAFFYSTDLDFIYLGSSLGIFALLLVFRWSGLKNLFFYLIPGIAMWYTMHHSGVHATIAGVLLAFTIPFDYDDSRSQAYKLLNILHKPVAWFILPLFALANTSIVLESNWISGLLTTNGIGIFFGFLIGKPLGILLFSMLAVWLGWSVKPSNVRWVDLAGVGFICGIGFTMAIFIALLAFPEAHLANNSKIDILVASMVAAIIGLVWLSFSLKKR